MSIKDEEKGIQLDLELDEQEKIGSLDAEIRRGRMDKGLRQNDTKKKVM